MAEIASARTKLPVRSAFDFSFVSSAVSPLTPGFPSARASAVELKDVCSKDELMTLGSVYAIPKFKRQLQNSVFNMMPMLCIVFLNCLPFI